MSVKGHVWKGKDNQGNDIYVSTTSATPTVNERAMVVWNNEQHGYLSNFTFRVGNMGGNIDYDHRINAVNNERELKYNKKPGTYTLRVCCYDSNAGDYVFNDNFQLNVPVGQNFIVDDYQADWEEWAQSVEYNSDGYATSAYGIEDEMVEDEYDLDGLAHYGQTPFGTLSRRLYGDTTFTLNELAKDQVITILMEKRTIR